MARKYHLEFPISSFVCEVKAFTVKKMLINFNSFNSEPFDTRSYLEFYVGLTPQMFTVHFYMLIFSSITSIFNAFHTFIDSLVVDYSNSLDNLNALLDDALRNKRNHKNNSINIQFETKRLLKDSIELHIEIVK